MEINKDKLIIYGAAAAFLIIAVCMFIPEKKTPEKAEEKPKNETTNIPDGETQEVNKSKMQGYESADQGRNRNSAADIYWNSQPETQITHEQVRQNSQEIFGTGNPTPSGGYTAPPPSNPYRETAEEREARHRRRQEEAIELAERMTSEETEEDSIDTESIVAEETVREAERVVVTRQSSSISSLDDDFSSSGLSSLDDESSLTIAGESHPFKCMFAKESKVKNGQRVMPVTLSYTTR